MSAESNDGLKNIYRERKVVTLKAAQFARLKKKKIAYVVHNGVGYEVRLERAPAIYTEDGQKITQAQARRLLKKLA